MRRLLIYFPIDNVEIHDILQAAKRSFPNAQVSAVEEGLLISDEGEGLRPEHIDTAISMMEESMMV